MTQIIESRAKRSKHIPNIMGTIILEHEKFLSKIMIMTSNMHVNTAELNCLNVCNKICVIANHSIFQFLKKQKMFNSERPSAEIPHAFVVKTQNITCNFLLDQKFFTRSEVLVVSEKFHPLG